MNRTLLSSFVWRSCLTKAKFHIQSLFTMVCLFCVQVHLDWAVPTNVWDSSHQRVRHPHRHRRHPEALGNVPAAQCAIQRVSDCKRLFFVLCRIGSLYFFFFSRKDERIKQVILLQFNHTCNESPSWAPVPHQHMIILFSFCSERNREWTLLTPELRYLQTAPFPAVLLPYFDFTSLFQPQQSEHLPHGYAWVAAN